MTTIKKSNSTTALDAVLNKAKNKITDVKVATNDYKQLPSPWSGYELNSANVLRSRKTGKPQQIPAGKKKYLIFNDKGERKSLGPEEIKTMVTFKKEPAKKVMSANDGESKKDIIMRLHSEGMSAKEIAETRGFKYNTVYECIYKQTILNLHYKGKTASQIAEKTGYSLKTITRQIKKYAKK